jgi:hypothetical protein
MKILVAPAEGVNRVSPTQATRLKTLQAGMFGTVNLLEVTVKLFLAYT